MFQFMTPVFLVRDPQLIKKMAVKDFDYFMDHRVIISEDVDSLFRNGKVKCSQPLLSKTLVISLINE